MKKIKKAVSLITVLSLILLFSVSPVLAEEAAGSPDGNSDSGNTIEQVSDSAETSGGNSETAAPGTSEEAAEDPTQGEAISVPAGDAPVADEEITEPVEEAPAAIEEPAVPAETIPDVPEITQPEVAPQGYDGNEVLNVVVPTMVYITIDPLELKGKGQIYSEVYDIRNCGDVDVLLTITDIQVTFSDDTNFQPLAQPFDETTSSVLKSIYMLLDFGRTDITPAAITDPDRQGEISIPLSSAQDTVENSSLSLSFSGNVNHLPEVPWQDDDVKISITYNLGPVPTPAAEEPASPPENAEAVPVPTEDVIITKPELPPTEPALEVPEAPSPDPVEGSSEVSPPDQTGELTEDGTSTEPQDAPDSSESGPPPAQEAAPPPATNP